MPDLDSWHQRLWLENERLRRALTEAVATLEAIRGGEVDALVIRQGGTNQVFTLEGADRPYRLFVEEMQQGAVTLDLDGMVLFCNHRFEHMLQGQGTPLPGQPFETHLAPGSLGAWRLLRDEGLRGRAIGELALRRRDGSPLPAFAAISPLNTPQGTTLALVVSDLTEQKQFEKLVVAERQLQQADKAKDHFLALLGHELRNPLAPMRNAVALMKLAPGADAAMVEIREVLERQLLHLTRLIDDLLDISRIASGKITLQPGAMDLTAVLRAAVTDQGPEMEAKGLAWSFRAPPEPIRAFADAVRITQIVSNLLVNAVKFTNPGGRVGVELGLDPHGKAVISVVDSGVGIDPGSLHQLFEPFMQIPQPTGHAHRGLGLGLALAKGLVRLHGGQIYAASEGPGQGASFTVVLPIVIGPPEEAERTAPLLGEPRARASRRILVIEDNLDFAKTLRMLVQAHGHTCRVAHSGPEGLAQAQTFKPEVVLCDVGLPGGMDGYAVARALRCMPDLGSAQLIAMTGFTQEKDRLRALAAGFDSHLAKPADPETLIRMIAR